MEAHPERRGGFISTYAGHRCEGVVVSDFRYLGDERRAELEKYEFMMGEARGRLAATLDCLTDALIMVGQHGVYCTSNRNPQVPALDLQGVIVNLNGAKELVSAVMERIRKEKEASEG
jgi:hypothetical protein